MFFRGRGLPPSCRPTLFVGTLVLGALAVLSIPSPATAQIQPVRADTAAADTTATDSLPDPARPNALGADTTAPARNAPVADTVTAAPPDSVVARLAPAAVDTGRVPRYLPTREAPGFNLFPHVSPFRAVRTPASQRAIRLDSTGTDYVVQDDPVADGTMRLTADTYRRERYRANRRDNWKTLVEQRRAQRNQRGGVGVSMVVPGGRESTFSTVFGKPRVDLRVNGQADIRAGFDYRRSDQQVSITGNASQIDPDFKQDLRLGITGTIGDKLQIDVDWDTNSQFDYQNQVKLTYTGYEDEIVQSIEAGNVSLQTPSQLISGGQSLFGIKSEFQLGNLELTTIASQQEGQSNSLSIEGGSQTTEFDLQPTDYDQDTHFFLGYYFRNTWNVAHQNPTSPTLVNGFNQITNIEVWKLRTSRSPSESDTRKATAVVDLGENPRLLAEANDYNEAVLPGPDRDQYSEGDLETLRNGETPAGLAQSLGSQDLVQGEFKRLERGRDYRINERLGFLSLTQRLRSNEALAIAFRYRANGEVRTIGDFSGDQGGTSGGIDADRLVLKLLRPSNPVAPTQGQAVAAWFLEMRNVYRLGGRGLTSDNFELDVEYEPPGQGARTSIPEVGGQQPLLRVLGLDRIDQNGARNPDNRFDFTPLTIDSEEGLLFFPYLQPFNEHILRVAEENGSREAGEPFAFPELYTKKKSIVENEDTEKNVYHLRGSYKGSTKEFYDLEAFTGLVEGSVEVTSGGQTLQEGTDYVVDYQGGTVTITNQSNLTAGRNINIDYEQNSLANLQQKTLLGARADWTMQDQFALGATLMRLSQDSPVDKFRIGQEPIKNTIWGVDGSMDLQPRWLTRAVDALPLVQTRAESSVSVTGEFAQLRPGHTTTEAYERTVQDVEESDRDSYADDERNGVSYIDDFEGFENTFSLRDQPSAWRVSAAPDSIAPGAPLNGLNNTQKGHQARTHWRGTFGWYQLNERIREQLQGKVEQRGNPEATALLDVREVFNRDTQGEANPTLRTLDVFFNPWSRGPYNYTDDILSFVQNPKQVWGGVTRRLPEGYTDFSVQNVEFVEFIVKVYPQNGQVTDDARLYIDLGTISEDVVPNGRLNTEDGLTSGFDPDDFDALSRIATGPQNGAIDIRGSRTEDVGIDGLVSYVDGSNPYDEGLLEQSFYGDFVSQADSALGAAAGLTPAERQRLRAMTARIQDDPSGDDYHYFENDEYFGDDRFFPEGATLQQRFSHYYAGYELNGYESQNQLAQDVSLRRGVARAPDTEDLDEAGGNVNTLNDYYQYAIPLDELESRATTDGGPTDYVVSRVGQDKDWYKVRIPVRNFTRKVGNIEDFSRIRALRMWTTGHEAPVTMRFASMELVGSQWRTSQPVAEEPVEEGEVLDEGEGELRVASINDEEDPQYRPPVGAIVSRNRTARGVQQRSREQALLLDLTKLEPGQQRGVFKTYGQGLDLLKYSNLRMYTHLHGRSNSPQVKERLRENLRLFVRLGSNETNDYYEYEQPLTPNDVPSTGGASPLWLEENEMNLVLSALNQLKTARDQSGTPTDTTFSTATDVNLPLSFAPDGTVLKVRGTPSLNSINTVVIGVRHVGDPDAMPSPAVLENIELWVNELRVSGFDERSGWAANASTNIELADLATVQGSFQRRTDGFGALSSTLNERQQSDNTSWNVRTDLQLGALFPERQGWSIPVTLQLQSNQTSPRFDPSRGDVRVQEVQDQFDALPDSTIQRRFGDRYPDRPIPAIREQLKDSTRLAAQTYNLRRTMTANLSKSGSDNWWMRQTMDATSLSFSYLNRTARSPQRQIDDQWSWSSSMQYRLDFGRSRTVQPLGFLPEAPVLGALADIDFNYVPTSLSFTADAQRETATTRSRPSPRASTTQELPSRVANPFRERQDFRHTRRFSLQYDPFGFLSLNYDTNTRQSLNDIAGVTQQNVIFSETSAIGKTVLTNVDTSAFFRNPQSFVDGLPEAYQTSARDSIGSTLFVEDRLQRRPIGDVLQRIFDGATPRTNQYGQRFGATLRLGLTDRQALNWIDLQDISYQASFDWQNGSRDSRTGANVGNSVTLRTGVSLRPNRVWERFGFFNRLKEAQRGEGGRSGDESAAPADTASGGISWDDVPLPDPMSLLRGMALTVLDINEISITYNGDRSSQSSNVGELPEGSSEVEADYSLYQALQGNGPSLGYRLGFDRTIAPSNRVLRENLQVSDALSDQHRFKGRTSLSPSSALQVDLNWTLEWRDQRTITFEQPSRPPGTGQTGPTQVQQFERESGNTTVSVWAFGSYTSFFEQQVETLEQNINATAEDPRSAAATALTNASVSNDFRSAFLWGGASGIGGNGFAPVPMPGWTIRYSGLGDWPLLGALVRNASLNHSYTAEYQSGFSSVSTAGEETSLSVGGVALPYRRADFNVERPRISEQFQPLIGIDLTWPGDLQTSLEWNRRVTTALRTASLTIEESKTSELSGRVSYRKRGLNLPLFGPIDNQLRLTLTLSRAVNDEREYNLRTAVQQAQAEGFNYRPEQARQGDNVSIISETTRLTIAPKITYTVSNRVTADFFLEYEKFNGDSRQPSYTNMNGGFNVRVSISEN